MCDLYMIQLSLNPGSTTASSIVWSVVIIISILVCPLSLSLPCLSGLIRHFALHSMRDLNPTSWAASVVQLVSNCLESRRSWV